MTDEAVEDEELAVDDDPEEVMLLLLEVVVKLEELDEDTAELEVEAEDAVRYNEYTTPDAAMMIITTTMTTITARLTAATLVRLYFVN